ncbi:unnamed protein product [Lasius platythorax]|uniref:Uncharacterized protein n=1 Tax=Lasius platythorax TaxID=488582 RepID=A0AAV2N0A0_9HYME
MEVSQSIENRTGRIMDPYITYRSLRSYVRTEYGFRVRTASPPTPSQDGKSTDTESGRQVHRHRVRTASPPTPSQDGKSIDTESGQQVHRHRVRTASPPTPS